MEKAYKFGINLYLLFNDFKQAYDMNNTEYLYQSLKEFGIPKKLDDLVKMTVMHSHCKVKIEGQLYNNFKVIF
jgi:hypothetical protein